MQKVTIIWWTSGFWKWLADFLLKEFSKEIELTITWTNENKAVKVSSELKCCYSLNNIKSVKDADVIVFSVPIAWSENIMKEICPHVKSWSVVLDVTSIKKGPSKIMRDFCNNEVLVIPTHPMFGPFVSSIASQIFVLTPEEQVKKDSRYIFLKTFLANLWAKVIESTPKEHDKMMAVVQWLTHFNMFVLAETLKRLKIDIKKSMNFISPIYKIMISSVSRYISQDPKLYWDIQMFNSEVLEVHKVFMEVTNNFNKFVKDKDETSFINTILEGKKYFWDNALAWQKYTDKIIYMISKQREKIENNLWKKVTLINIYSKEQVIWIITKFENNYIFLENLWEYNIDEWEIV